MPGFFVRFVGFCPAHRSYTTLLRSFLSFGSFLKMTPRDSPPLHHLSCWGERGSRSSRRIFFRSADWLTDWLTKRREEIDVLGEKNVQNMKRLGRCAPRIIGLQCCWLWTNGELLFSSLFLLDPVAWSSLLRLMTGMIMTGWGNRIDWRAGGLRIGGISAKNKIFSTIIRR